MLARDGGGPGGLLGMGGGGGAPGRDCPPGTTGAARPSKVFWRVAEDGGDAGARPPGAGAGPLGRDFFAASPSKTSRSEPALSLIAFAL